MMELDRELGIRTVAIRAVVVLAVTIFLTETLLMLVFFRLELGVSAALIDSSVLTVALSPILYLVAYRPLARALAARSKAHETVARLAEVTHEQVVELARANESKAMFINTLSHELRTPLAAILSATEILSMGPDDAGRRRALEVIDRNVRSQARLIDELLDLSRLTRGKAELELKPVDLCGIIAAQIEAERAAAAASHVAIRATLPNTGVMVLADSRRLAQVVANLISNAIKATTSEEGGVVSITAGAEGGQAIVRVRDTGIGIPPEMLGAIFEPFQQVETSRVRSRGGLGIGLTIVRSIVDLFHGRVTAASEGTGKGSEFTVTLPLYRGGARVAEQPALALPTLRRHVLVVEDDDDVRDMMSQILETLGNTVIAVPDAPAALEAAAREPFDLALVDIGLPTIDGYELARRLRVIPGFRAKLVALSGYSSDQHRQRAEQAGFDEQLVKPADLAALRSALAPSPTARPEGTA